MVDDTVLVADELVSNAHQHGRASRRCRLALIEEDRCVRIEVDDARPLNSAGLTMLLEATDRAEAHRESLRIVVDANRPVIRPIQVTGLDHELALYHTVDEAVKADEHPD